MIPKTIHYCWFGPNKEPEIVQKYKLSWKIHLPDYKIICWNEQNFNINSNKYVQQAYEKGKWAFITDYVRLYVLYQYGGIYMDADVEVLKNLDAFLNHRAFSGYENDYDITTGIMASEKGHPWIKDLLDYYNNKSFIKSDGSLDLTTNVITITQITKEKYGFKSEKGFQTLRTGIVFYPKEYFCPNDHGKIIITENTHTIHHFSGSWMGKKGIRKRKILDFIGRYRTLTYIYNKLRGRSNGR